MRKHMTVLYPTSRSQLTFFIQDKKYDNCWGSIREHEGEDHDNSKVQERQTAPTNQGFLPRSAPRSSPYWQMVGGRKSQSDSRNSNPSSRNSRVRTHKRPNKTGSRSNAFPPSSRNTRLRTDGGRHWNSLGLRQTAATISRDRGHDFDRNRLESSHTLNSNVVSDQPDEAIQRVVRLSSGRIPGQGRER